MNLIMVYYLYSLYCRFIYDLESKTSSQALNKDIDKKITFSDLKGLQDQVYCANDPQTQLKYAKKLIQVASDLSNDNMKDTKFVKKNKEKYLSDAYSIIKGLVNSVNYIYVYE